tara:strand:+ start:2324 stop:2503 length:180 start_codon:yes stop_codon:yes gene_type:complete
VDLFKTLQAGVDIKQAEDVKKALEEKGKLPPNSYNVALREFSKLCINAISGKVTEGLHL